MMSDRSHRQIDLRKILDTIDSRRQSDIWGPSKNSKFQFPRLCSYRISLIGLIGFGKRIKKALSLANRRLFEARTLLMRCSRQRPGTGPPVFACFQKAFLEDRTEKYDARSIK